MKIYWSGESKNIIGPRIRILRQERGLTQRALAEQMQLIGVDCTDLTILRIERGERFVPDYEVKALSQVLCVSYDFLFND